MRKPMVVIADFHNTFEAELAKNQLEDEGIAAVLEDGTAGDVDRGTGFTTTQLHVARKDLPRARRILAALIEEPSAYQPALAARRADGWTYCSGCGSEVSMVFEACPSCGGTLEERDEERADQDEEVPPSLNDRLAERAWRTAVFGCVTVPLIFHLYSFGLLLQLLVTPGEVSMSRWPKLCGALFIDVFVFTVAVLLIKGIAF